MAERLHTVVVGAGHAGLAMSRVLTDLGIEHLVLDRGRVAERWRAERWDSLRLLTPNWASALPGWSYAGPDPDGFMDRDEVVDYLEGYARSFAAPVRAGVDVTSVGRGPRGLHLRTTGGEIDADNVVAATGGFQAPRVPAVARALPPGVEQVHSSAYRRPEALAPGAVLVVGAGPSGQQIAEELLAAGRRVFLSVGRHRRVPRRYRGRDYYWWLERTGFYAKTSAEVPVAEQRAGASPALTGARGAAHDLDLRRLAAEGATLLGRIGGIDDGRILLAPDLAETLAQGDRALEQFVAWVEARLDLPGEPFDEPGPSPGHPDPPEVADPPAALDLEREGVGAVVWATGFAPAFADWIGLPVLDDDGHPVHERGVTAVPGMFFLGLHWLHRLRSAFIRGAQEDALYLAERIVARG